MHFGQVATAAIALAAAGPAQFADQLTKEHRAQLVGMQPRIDAAIDKGVAWLLQHQLRDGSWGYEGTYFATGQTALAAYTLMKAGLPKTHSAVQRALTFIANQRPTMVYACGCQLLALAESGDPRYLEHMEQIVEDLLDWQHNGSWAYPNEGGRLGHLHSDRDLSITQFAALGLRAAQRAGIEIKPSVWRRVLDAAMDYQEKPKKVATEVRSGRTGSGQTEIAGFRYRFGARTPPSASITTAGVASVAIARRQLGTKIGRRDAREAQLAIDRGVAWLAHHYDVKNNPGGGREWQLYYLYGLERVAAFVEAAYLGGRAWYLDGANELLAIQADDGHWHRRHAEPDTCFAILFLKRATAPTTGQKRIDPKVTIAEDPKHDVGMRARGGLDGSPLDLWITRLGKPNEEGKPAPAPIVERVEYLIDGTVAATVAGNAEIAWRGEGFHTRQTFATNGERHVAARVHVLRAPDRTKAILETPGFKIRVDHVLEPWMLEAARAAAQNELFDIDVDAQASSQLGDNNRPVHACDQLEGTAWCSAPNDANPTLQVELLQPIKAKTIVFAQVGGQRTDAGHFDRITKIHLWLNRQRKPVEITLDPDSRIPTRYDLAKTTTVRKLKIAVLGREPGLHHHVVGFSEIQLLR